MRIASLGLVLLLGVPWYTASAEPAAWETVTSKEGQFTVEMPAKPNLTSTRTRKELGGTVKVLSIACKTDGGLYLAMRVDFSTPIEKGKEDEALDEERNAFAEEFKGKVMTEKKVRAEGKLGRDFTIRGKPDDKTTLTIRVRTYLAGNVAYSVGVISAPNRELPEDAGRFLGSLALGERKARAAGTPEPEPKGKELTGWGLAIDPGNDCQFRPADKSLAIEVPGTLHDLNPDSGKLNAPRVMREVEGDFVLTAKVVGDFQPGGKSTNPKGVPYNGAGMVIWSDSDNFIRLERGAMLRSGKVVTYVAFEEREGGYRGATHNEAFAGGNCYLRLERKGSRIMGAISTDGSKWKEVKPIDTVWPAKLRVGFTAINSSSEPFTFKFEEVDFKGKEARK